VDDNADGTIAPGERHPDRAGKADFIGLNYYFRGRVTGTSRAADPIRASRRCHTATTRRAAGSSDRNAPEIRSACVRANVLTTSHPFIESLHAGDRRLPGRWTRIRLMLQPRARRAWNADVRAVRAVPDRHPRPAGAVPTAQPSPEPARRR